MALEYKIEEFDEASGEALVRYFSKDVPGGYATRVELPVVDGAYPTPVALDELLQELGATLLIFQRAAEVKQRPDAEHIKALMNVRKRP